MESPGCWMSLRATAVGIVLCSTLCIAASPPALVPQQVPPPSTQPARTEELRQALIKCYAAYPSVAEVRNRCLALLPEVRGTTIEDDVLLALARATIQDGKPQDAIAILTPLVEDKTAEAVDLANLWRGGMSPKESHLLMLFTQHYQKHPTYTADNAMLLLSSAYAKAGDQAKAWDNLRALHAKYPEGDRVREDAQFLRELRESDAIPQRYWRPDQFGYDICVPRRRPHMVSLLSSLYIDDVQKRSTATERLGIGEMLVRLYAPMLMGNEVLRVCDDGLRLAAEVAPDTKINGVSTVAEAIAMFKREKEAVLAEQARNPLPLLKVVPGPGPTTRSGG